MRHESRCTTDRDTLPYERQEKGLSNRNMLLTNAIAHPRRQAQVSSRRIWIGKGQDAMGRFPGFLAFAIQALCRYDNPLVGLSSQR
jgi:hypothetical protein